MTVRSGAQVDFDAGHDAFRHGALGPLGREVLDALDQTTAPMTVAEIQARCVTAPARATVASVLAKAADTGIVTPTSTTSSSTGGAWDTGDTTAGALDSCAAALGTAGRRTAAWATADAARAACWHQRATWARGDDDPTTLELPPGYTITDDGEIIDHADADELHTAA